jgi:glycosyltransferase involved in cell wall biosynthesis
LIKEIAPYIHCGVIIVGNGMNNAINIKEIPSNVFIYNYVEDLSDFYVRASAVIVPVFFGSGMKVKIAEAMMYGKKILATPLAFYGYKTDLAFCSVCNNAENFISEIDKIDLLKCYYKESRQMFIDNYSFEQNDRYYSQIYEYINDNNV